MTRKNIPCWKIMIWLFKDSMNNDNNNKVQIQGLCLFETTN